MAGLPVRLFIYRIERLQKILTTVEPKNYNFEELGKAIGRISKMLISTPHGDTIKTKKGEIISNMNQYILSVLEGIMKELGGRIEGQKKLLEDAKEDLSLLSGRDHQTDALIQAQTVRLEYYLQRFGDLYTVIKGI